MTELFSRRAAWLFGIAIPVALAVVLLAPVPFMRGLGAVALVCAVLGCALHASVLRRAAAHEAPRDAYWPVGETLAAARIAPAAPAATVRSPRRREPRLSFPRMVALPRPLPFFPGRLPSRMTSHA